MSIFTFVTIIVAATTATDSASVHSAPEWNDLRTTWGRFNKQPRTVQQAKTQGYKLVGSSNCEGTGVYNGIAYAKDDDYAITLLYDVNGLIAGIQHGITKEEADQKSYPTQKLQPPFVFIEDRYVMSVYFIDPSKICTVGRTESEFKDEGTGTHLWLQTGNTPRDVMLIPRKEKDLARPKWTETFCMYTMGKHFMYDLNPNMDCEALLPVFLLYNEGKLNAFGWTLFADLSSPSYENLGKIVVKFFKPDIPCVNQIASGLTFHIFLTSTPTLNFC